MRMYLPHVTAGDEFVLVYTGKTDEEICQMMAHLKSNMERIALPGTKPLWA